MPPTRMQGIPQALPGMHRFFQGPPLEMLATELLYFAVVVSICLIIYFRTRELYSVSQHKGLFHFRNVFLYFAAAYSLRLLQLVFQLSSEVLEITPWRGFSIVLPLVSYFSTLAILSLPMALMAARFKQTILRETIALHLTAFVSLLLVFATGSQALLLLIQSIVLLASVLAIFMAPKQAKHKFLSQNRVTYLLLAAFWVVNLLALTKRLLPMELKLALYPLSAIVFVSLFLRVRKRLPSNVKKKKQA